MRLYTETLEWESPFFCRGIVTEKEKPEYIRVPGVCLFLIRTNATACSNSSLPFRKRFKNWHQRRSISCKEDVSPLFYYLSCSWAFHAVDDTTVSPKNTQEMVAAIQAQNGNLIHYTEYEAGIIKPVGHFSWVPALQNQDMIEWLFA